ncbi:MAG: hypothetical protein R3D90_09540 [Paracoccaceae bacterium]
MRFFGAAVVAMAMAGAGWAQEVIDTPSGPAVIEKGADFTHVLRIAGANFPIEGMMSVAFGERLGTLVLVAQYTGGTGCPAMFAWLDTTPGKVRLTETFGTCSDMAKVTADAETVTVTMPGPPGQGRSAFVWDAKGRIVEQKLGMEPTGLAPDRGVGAWVGRHPYELVTAPEWAGVFTVLMGGAALERLQAGIAIGTGMEMQGDWLTGQGCQPHMCDVVASAVAVHAGDLRVLVAYWEQGKGAQLWGDGSAGIPPAIAEVMARR